MISPSRSLHSSLQASLAHLPSRTRSPYLQKVLAWYASIPQRALWATLAVLAVFGSIPAFEAYGAAPFTLLSTTSETTAQPLVVIEITRETVDSYTGPTISSLSDVHTQMQLVDFAVSLMREDSAIQRITIGEDSLSMTYRSSVRMLHFGKRTIERTVAVRADGTVALTRPWYAQYMNTKGSVSDPTMGFSDIAVNTDSGGITVASAARLLVRMHGRLQIGAL